MVEEWVKHFIDEIFGEKFTHTSLSSRYLLEVYLNLSKYI